MISASDILKGRILIVDDERGGVRLLEDMLREAGYHAITSTLNPCEVRDLHQQNRYTLILLDLQDPGLDGFQVMEDLKALEPGCYLPVLAIASRPDEKWRAIKAGAKDFISKPFDRPEVLVRVHNMMEARLLHLEEEMRTVQAEERLIESQKMDAIGHLAAGVAHDFNNIIAIVLGYSELLMEKIGPEKELRTQLEAIRSAGARAAGLTRQLLIFSRKQAVQPVVLDLNDVVRDMDELLQPLMHENIEVSVVLGKQIGRVRADAGYIGQVLVNLIVNARDAMPQGGKLTIATSNAALDENYARAHSGVNPGDYVMLNVSDTGAGMTDAVKARLFEVFFTTKPKGQGTGLGLATCRTIVQQAGGHIGVYSEVGVGSTFKVYFPRVDQPVKAASRKPAARPLPRGTETLLVVEDDSSLRTLARDLLEAQGYGLLAASNGAAALETVRAHQGPPISLVITDVIMPVMGGKEMAEWLRTTNPDLKILFTSGYTDDAMSCRGLLQPGVEFIPKPYTPATLVRRVRTMLDQTGNVKSKSVPISLAVMA